MLEARWLSPIRQTALMAINLQHADGMECPISRRQMAVAAAVVTAVVRKRQRSVQQNKRQRMPQNVRNRKQKTESEGQASRMYDSLMQVCASANSSALGNYLQLWFKFVPELLGYPGRDCATVNTRAYSDALDIFSKKYDMCYTNAQRD